MREHDTTRQHGGRAKPPPSSQENFGGTRTPASDAIYTCSMRSEMRRPGTGYLLDLTYGAGPRTASTAEAAANPELADMRRRFWVRAMLTVPLVVIAGRRRLRAAA